MDDNKVKVVAFAPLSLYTDADESGETYASLSWAIRGGYPRMTVYTENTRSRDRNSFSFDKLIIAPMDPITINIVIENLKQVIKSETEIKLSMRCYNVKYVNDQKTDDVALQSTVIIGKSKDGVVYLAAVAEGKKKVKFNLLPNSKWHKYNDAKGNEITDKKVLSNYFSTAYCNRLKSLMDKHLADDSVVKITDRKGGSSTSEIPTKDLVL